ncbi:metallophosphoesterase [Bacillus freudenreichii]|nr:metallophosphoesterase [Bacillus freudenreichii]
MKLAFISDIHGNAIALEAVLNDISKKKVDEIFILGDLCYRGPEPKRSLELIRDLKCSVIKGNADEWVVRGIRKGEVPDHVMEKMNQEQEWTVSQLTDSDIQFLQRLPQDLIKEVEGFRIHAFHATPDNLFETVSPSESNEILSERLMTKNADVYIYAHIHHSYIRFINGKCLINTGSVGLPFDGVKKPSYALVELREGNLEASIVRVDYDMQAVINQIKESNYPNKDLMIHLLKNASL